MKFKKRNKWITKTTSYDSTDNVTYSIGTFNSVIHIDQLKDNCSKS